MRDRWLFASSLISNVASKKLLTKKQASLNANQLKLIELNTLIMNFKNYLRNIFIIFGIFNLIAIIPMIINIYSEIRSRIKLSR